MDIDNNKIQLAIVDDEQLIVSLLKTFFQQKDQIEVIITAHSGEDFLTQLADSQILPDIVLLDLRMKEVDGIETSNILQEKYPSIKIIIVSSHYKGSFVGYMLKTGVNAFLPKGILPDQLFKIVKIVATTGHYFFPEQVATIRSQIIPQAPKPKISLEVNITSREKEILNLICQQHTAQEIADKLFIAKRTVEGHKNKLLSKFGVKNTAGLVIYAVKHKLIDIESMND